MPPSSSIDMTMVRQWVTSKMDHSAVEQFLQEKGLDKESVMAHLKAFKREKHARRSFIGFILMGAGAFMGFLSCVLTLINPIPELYYVILYGFTSLAILVICAGLYYAFE
jgi:hypothetical protein